MKIIHLSNNSLAGAPFLLSSALKRHSGHEVRLIDTKRFGMYEHDVVFEETPEEAVRLIESADLLHLHNYLDLDSKDFAPVDLRKLAARGVLILRHFHSIPEIVADRMRRPLADVLGCTLPAVCVAQCAERFYPRARVVPNLVPLDHPLYVPWDGQSGEPLDIFFSPSKTMSAWEDRWNAKGAPEILAMLGRLRAETGCRFEWMTNRPHAEVMAAKQRSRIVLDDMVTGSYHLSGMEGLSQGKAVLGYLDERMCELIKAMSGASWHPYLNVRLEDAPAVLRYLLSHPDETADIGRESRAWMERHWRESRLVGHFLDTYERLAQGPDKVRRQEALRIDRGLRRFQVLTLQDVVFSARKDVFGRRGEAVRSSDEP